MICLVEPRKAIRIGVGPGSERGWIVAAYLRQEWKVVRIEGESPQRTDRREAGALRALELDAMHAAAALMLKAVSWQQIDRPPAPGLSGQGIGVDGKEVVRK